MVEQSAIAGITRSTLCMNGSKTTSHRSIKRWSISSLDFIWCFTLGLVSLSLWCTLTKSQRSDSNIFWGLLDGNLHLTRRRRTAASWASRDDSLPKSCSHSDQWSMQMSVERERERGSADDAGHVRTQGVAGVAGVAGPIQFSIQIRILLRLDWTGVWFLSLAPSYAPNFPLLPSKFHFNL